MYFTQQRLKLYLGALLVLQIFACISFRDSIRSGAIDFRSYYTAGYMVRTGQSRLMYDYATEHRLQNALITPAPIALPSFAPPFAALLFVPLSCFRYLWALLVFALLNLGFLFLAIRIMRPYLSELTARWPPVPALLFLSFLPVVFTLAMGQLSILILLIDCLAFALLETGQPLLAGLVFSLALVKFQIAVPVALLFLLWRRWRFTVGFVVGAATLLAISAWIMGPHGLLPYVRSILGMSSLAGTSLQGTVGVAPRRMASLYGLFFCLTPGNRLATILTLVASLILILWTATRRPSLPLALIVGLLVSYHLYPCDLTLLLLPLSLLCNRLFSERADVILTAAHGFPWIQNLRPKLLFCSIGAFLIGPLMAEIVSNDLIFLFSLPMLALAACPLDWSIVALPRAAESITEPAPTAA